GWLDAVQLRYAVRVNGLQQLVLTKLDVLSGFDTIRICVGYDIDGRRVDTFPASLRDLMRAKPIYEEHPGWQEDLSTVTSPEQLPDAALAYIRRIEELTGVAVVRVSVGPGRDQTLVLGALN